MIERHSIKLWSPNWIQIFIFVSILKYPVDERKKLQRGTHRNVKFVPFLFRSTIRSLSLLKNSSVDIPNLCVSIYAFPIEIFYHITSIEILVLERTCLSCSCKHFGRKNLVKSLLISTLDKVIYYIGTFLQGSTKPHFTSLHFTK
jgi:hypothetical protein